MTRHHTAYDAAAQSIIEQIGKTIVIGIGLGIGKPIGLINALYRLAAADNSIQLTIMTALTLSRPLLKNELEKRFVTPFLNRLLKDYEDPLYEIARQEQTLPNNIRVIEFFLAPAKFLHNKSVQQNYINSAYTLATRDIAYHKINVLAQQLAHSKNDPRLYSLSCNSDLYTDMIAELQCSGRKFAVVAEVNAHLPYMYGDAVLPEETFTDIIDTGNYRHLFSLPREEISPQDHLIGLYTSYLIPDGSCLQIGIGTLSNAVANALIMRHANNAAYIELLNTLEVADKFANIINIPGTNTLFSEGLYASTEMLSDEYIQLMDAGILKKRVYDHIGLQRLLNEKKLSETITPDYLTILLEHQIIHSSLTENDLKFLTAFGIFKNNIHYENGAIVLEDGETIAADLSIPEARQKIIATCLGTELQGGIIAHAGFFIGSTDLYSRLHSLTTAEAKLINMTTIARTNALTWAPELLQLQRQNARLINSAMMVTLGGVIVSDGLKDMQEVSGVGGQFDFVYMGQYLRNARSIINCRSTRSTKDGVQSNIVWDYSNITIPRYLRDIIITEYGIADCRSKTDSEIIQAILNITDSRFQDSLLAKAKQTGKIPTDYVIPEKFRHNSHTKIINLVKNLQARGFCQPYPFGNDFTPEEEVIAKALLALKESSRFKILVIIICALFNKYDNKKLAPYLERMKLLQPKNITELLYKKLLQYMITKNI